MSYCKVIAIGRLGADPEIRYTQSGNPVSNFRIAVDAGWGEKKRTDWHRCTAWGKVGETIANNVRKGSLVLIEGRLENREWQHKDGQTRQSTEIVVDRWSFVGPRPQQESASAIEYSSQEGADDIPF